MFALKNYPLNSSVLNFQFYTSTFRIHVFVGINRLFILFVLLFFNVNTYCRELQ